MAEQVKRTKTKYPNIYYNENTKLYDVKYNYKVYDPLTQKNKYKAKWKYNLSSLAEARGELAKLQTGTNKAEDKDITLQGVFDLWKNKAGGQNFSPVTIRNTEQQMKMIYQFLPKETNIMCSDAQYQMLLKTKNSNLKSALVLSKNFGLRASECSKLQYRDIKEDGIYIADSKGKKSRFVKAENKEQQDILQQFRGKKQGRICPIQTGSLQQAFNRECKKQGIHFQNGAFHTLRKNFATAKYKEYREKGETVQQALDSVSHVLGHGSKRNELMKQYICCPLE